ncbi:MAG: CPBP family intramembrane metalloprotease [Bacteroidetes bacterium]|nr:CPBP family intramembrane metalloprotease [Bacteroidota bacterium]
MAGFFILGVIPAVLYFYFFDTSFSKFGLTGSQLKSNFFVILILIIIIAFILFVNQKVNSRRNSLQLKLNEWNLFLFTLNCLGWIIYLIGYEFLFRGILLQECYINFGLWPAIAINVAIYSAIHMVNGKEEAMGALIFGAIACYLTLIRGTILIPIFMHISLSLFSDYFSILLNKNLSFVMKNNH